MPRHRRTPRPRREARESLGVERSHALEGHRLLYIGRTIRQNSRDFVLKKAKKADAIERNFKKTYEYAGILVTFAYILIILVCNVFGWADVLKISEQTDEKTKALRDALVYGMVPVGAIISVGVAMWCWYHDSNHEKRLKEVHEHLYDQLYEDPEVQDKLRDILHDIECNDFDEPSSLLDFLRILLGGLSLISLLMIAVTAEAQTAAKMVELANIVLPGTFIACTCRNHRVQSLLGRELRKLVDQLDEEQEQAENA